MLQTITVADSGLSSSDQISRILLTCALLRSRQYMSADVSLSISISGAAKAQAITLALQLQEETQIDTLLHEITRKCEQQEEHRNPDEVVNEDERIQVTRRESSWDINGHFPLSHAGTFDTYFSHVYLQVAEAPVNTTISRVQTTRIEDIRWLQQNAIHDIPPSNPTDAVSMFQQIVKQWPDKAAVEAWDGNLTYSELEAESTRVAKALVTAGVSPGTTVPLIFEFSKWVLVSLLATWKAEAAFVFLDPNHPIGRLQTLARRVEASFALTQERHLTLLSNLGVTILTLEDVLQGEGAFDSALPESVDTRSTAYVIFTSGSTGEPKAVVHTHLAFCSGVVHQAQLLGFSEETRTLQNAPLIFAGTIPELLFTLLRGGCLCIPQQDERIKDLPACVQRFHSNMLILSSTWAAIHDPEKFRPRQTLLMGAEPLPAHTAQKWAALHDNRNGYGSSETNTVATCFSTRDAVSSQSVGPGAAHQYWIVDALNLDRLTPPGWLGEVVVEGHALASGYRGNDAASDKAFPRLPRWYSEIGVKRSEPTRFFRSGDLGRIAKDGTLEVHGRTDPLQVKLRGQRIELGEIEAITINGLPQMSPVAAELILPKGQDRPAIAVFIVVSIFIEDLDTTMFAQHILLSTLQKTQLDQLKVQLGQIWNTTLPSFMRPTYLIPLAQLPRTATGKLDRQQLRRWSSQYGAVELGIFSTSRSRDQNRRPLTTDNELKLGKALRKVLAVPEDCLDDNAAFTVLGGDSLAAIQLSQELRSQGLLVSPQEIIQSDTLSSLAANIRSESAITLSSNVETKTWNESFSEEHVLQALSLQRDQVHTISPTTDSQSRAIELGTGPERCFVFHFILTLDNGLDKSRLIVALQGLTDRQDILRTLFTRQDGRILQIVLKAMKCPLELQELDKDQSLEHAVQAVTTSNIHIDEVPTKFWLFSTGHVSNAVVLRLSHAQFDGLSIPILWESLGNIYSAQPLPPAPQFSTYADAVLRRDLESSIHHFKDLLSDVPFTDLVGRAPTSNKPQNRHLHRRLSFTPKPGFTPAHLFEAAWGYVLAKSSRARAVVFDQIVSGRNVNLPPNFDARLLVGPCLNDVPVVARFPHGQTLRELLVQIRDQHSRALGIHETLGFGKILRECTPAHWPRNARMTSSVQYRGFEERSVFHVDGVRCTVTMVERSMDLEDLTVLVTPLRKQDSGSFDVEFLFSDEVVSDDQAERWFEELIRGINIFTADGALENKVEDLMGAIED